MKYERCPCGCEIDWDALPAQHSNGKWIIYCDECGTWCEGDSALDAMRLWNTRQELQS